MDNQAPLHILLTNDDGHSAPGIQILRDTLKRHGYRVTMVAPSGCSGVQVVPKWGLPVKMGHHDPGVDPGIGSPCGDDVYGLPKERAQPVFQDLLYGMIFRLSLPSVIMLAKKREMHEVPHEVRSVSGGKDTKLGAVLAGRGPDWKMQGCQVI